MAITLQTYKNGSRIVTHQSTRSATGDSFTSLHGETFGADFGSYTASYVFNGAGNGVTQTEARISYADYAETFQGGTSTGTDTDASTSDSSSSSLYTSSAFGTGQFFTNTKVESYSTNTSAVVTPYSSRYTGVVGNDEDGYSTYTGSFSATGATTTAITEGALTYTTSTTQTVTAASRTSVMTTGSFTQYQTAIDTDAASTYTESYARIFGTVVVAAHDEVLASFGEGSFFLSQGSTASRLTIWETQTAKTFNYVAVNATYTDSPPATTTAATTGVYYTETATSSTLAALHDVSYSYTIGSYSNIGTSRSVITTSDSTGEGATFTATRRPLPFITGVLQFSNNLGSFTTAAAGGKYQPITFTEQSPYLFTESSAMVGSSGQSTAEAFYGHTLIASTGDINNLMRVRYSTGNQRLGNSAIGNVVTASRTFYGHNTFGTVQKDEGSYANLLGSDTYSTHKGLVSYQVSAATQPFSITQALSHTTAASFGSTISVTTSNHTSATFSTDSNGVSYTLQTIESASSMGVLVGSTFGSDVTLEDGFRVTATRNDIHSNDGNIIYGGYLGTDNRFAVILQPGQHVFHHGVTTSSAYYSSGTYFTTTGSAATYVKPYPVIWGPAIIVLPRTYL